MDDRCTIAICATFRQQALEKEVTKLRDATGAIKTPWEDLTKISRENFVTLFGSPNPTACLEATIEEILQA